jgi:hypothetical protein
MADDLFEQMLDDAGDRARATLVDAVDERRQREATPRLLDPGALAAPGWDDGVDPALLAGPSAVTSLGARTRAVAYTRPLHELEANKGRLGGESWSRLNLIELGFHAIDVVALRMDFDAGARHDDVITAVASLARLQDPQLDEGLRVGERVLEGLITGRSTTDAEAHQGSYGAWGPDGYVAKRFDYALLTEHVDADGAFFLRATDAAITVLIGALELDVESAQVAAELRLNELVRRGMLAAAIEEAKRAGYRSIQYQEQLRRQLADARLHTTEPGAMAAVDLLVDHALEHVVDRYRAERSIIGNVSVTRDEATDERNRRRANQLIEQLEDCERRHQRLQQRLLRARRDFREAHASQLASPPPPPSVVDLERQLLRPALEATLAGADQLVDVLFRLSGAPHPPAVVDLDRLTGALSAVPVEDNLGRHVDDDPDDLVDAPARRHFTDDTWDSVDALFDSIDRPTRLSELIDRAEEPDGTGAVAHLLALRAGHGLDPGLAERRRTPLADDQPILAVAPTGEGFTSANLAGDDLWLAPGWVRTDVAEVPTGWSDGGP